ncbi:MAG: hypothetical protein WCJ71_00815 [Candidatus Omnitrophota bacterium]
MKKNGFLLCVVMLLLSVPVFSGAALAASRKPPAPIMQNLKGDVTVKLGSSDKWESVKEPGFQLKNGSTVRTAQGSAEIFCPDGSTLKFEPNTTASLSIAGDGRVQIHTAQGSVNATLGKSSIKTQIGPDQIVQEKYNPQTTEIDISCVKGNSTLSMPNGAKVALTKGDVITASPKDRSVKVQAGKAKVTQGTNTRPLDVGFQVFFPRKKPSYVWQFPVARGRYGYMTDSFVTNGEYVYTDEYLSQQEAFFSGESVVDQEGVAWQEAWEEGDAVGDASLQKEDLEDSKFTEGQSLPQDDRGSSLEQEAQETAASGASAGNDSVSDASSGVDNGSDDNSGAASVGNDSVSDDSASDASGGVENGSDDNSGAASVGNDSISDDSSGVDNGSDDNSGAASVGNDSVSDDSSGVDNGSDDNSGADSGGGDSGGDSGGGDSGGDSGGGDSGGGE